MPYTPYFLNPILAKAWEEFVAKGRPIIIRAAERCGISPFNPNAENFQGSAVSTTYDLVAAEKKREAAQEAEAEAEITRTETASTLTVLQLKAAAPDNTLVLRASAASFFEKSFIKPAQELQRELKEQRELKKQTAPLEVDRAVPETSVGRWVTAPLLSRLKHNGDLKAQKLEEKKEKQIENKSKKAQVDVALLAVGATALDKLRADCKVSHVRTRTPALRIRLLLLCA